MTGNDGVAGILAPAQTLEAPFQFAALGVGGRVEWVRFARRAVQPVLAGVGAPCHQEVMQAGPTEHHMG